MAGPEGVRLHLLLSRGAPRSLDPPPLGSTPVPPGPALPQPGPADPTSVTRPVRPAARSLWSPAPQGGGELWIRGLGSYRCMWPADPAPTRTAYTLARRIPTVGPEGHAALGTRCQGAIARWILHQNLNSNFLRLLMQKIRWLSQEQVKWEGDCSF